MPLLVAFVILPMVEIALFILVGGWIGLWPTLGLVVLAALVGAMILRHAGLSAVADLRGQMGALRNPLSEMARRAMTVIAGLLLLLPGFFSDAIALLLLLPPVQTALIASLAARVAVRGASMPSGSSGSGATYGGPGRGPANVIDAEYYEIDPDHSNPPSPGSSGWTRH
jgi:UPF0716 protein FxsA